METQPDCVAASMPTCLCPNINPHWPITTHVWLTGKHWNIPGRRSCDLYHSKCKKRIIIIMHVITHLISYASSIQNNWIQITLLLPLYTHRCSVAGGGAWSCDTGTASFDWVAIGSSEAGALSDTASWEGVADDYDNTQELQRYSKYCSLLP